MIDSIDVSDLRCVLCAEHATFTRVARWKQHMQRVHYLEEEEIKALLLALQRDAELRQSKPATPAPDPATTPQSATDSVQHSAIPMPIEDPAATLTPPPVSPPSSSTPSAAAPAASAAAAGAPVSFLFGGVTAASLNSFTALTSTSGTPAAARSPSRPKEPAPLAPTFDPTSISSAIAAATAAAEAAPSRPASSIRIPVPKPPSTSTKPAAHTPIVSSVTSVIVSSTPAASAAPALPAALSVAMEIDAAAAAPPPPSSAPSVSAPVKAEPISDALSTAPILAVEPRAAADACAAPDSNYVDASNDSFNGSSHPHPSLPPCPPSAAHPSLPPMIAEFKRRTPANRRRSSAPRRSVDVSDDEEEDRGEERKDIKPAPPSPSSSSSSDEGESDESEDEEGEDGRSSITPSSARRNTPASAKRARASSTVPSSSPPKPSAASSNEAGASCHFCRAFKPGDVIRCHAPDVVWRGRPCKKCFCRWCLARHFHITMDEVDEPSWSCPCCTKTCRCAYCRKTHPEWGMMPPQKEQSNLKLTLKIPKSNAAVNAPSQATKLASARSNGSPAVASSSAREPPSTLSQQLKSTSKHSSLPYSAPVHPAPQQQQALQQQSPTALPPPPPPPVRVEVIYVHAGQTIERAVGEKERHLILPRVCEVNALAMSVTIANDKETAKTDSNAIFQQFPPFSVHFPRIGQPFWLPPQAKYRMNNLSMDEVYVESASSVAVQEGKGDLVEAKEECVPTAPILREHRGTAPLVILDLFVQPILSPPPAIPSSNLVKPGPSRKRAREGPVVPAPSSDNDDEQQDGERMDDSDRSNDDDSDSSDSHPKVRRRRSTKGTPRNQNAAVLNGVAQHQCPTCSRFYISKESLRVHQLRSHGHTATVCQRCGVLFHTRLIYRYHQCPGKPVA